MKHCPSCNSDLSEESFSSHRGNKDGLMWCCRACRSRKRKAVWAANKNGRSDVLRAQARANSPVIRDKMPIERILMRSARYSRVTTECTITESLIAGLLAKQEWKCYYSGVQLEDVRGAHHAFKPSLDRKDPTKGYTPDNVVICSWIVNRMKNTMQHDEFIACLNTISSSVFASMWSKAA